MNKSIFTLFLSLLLTGISPPGSPFRASAEENQGFGKALLEILNLEKEMRFEEGAAQCEKALETFTEPAEKTILDETLARRPGDGSRRCHARPGTTRPLPRPR